MLWHFTLDFTFLLSNTFLYTCPPLKKKSMTELELKKQLVLHPLSSLLFITCIQSFSYSNINPFFFFLHVILDPHIHFLHINIYYWSDSTYEEHFIFFLRLCSLALILDIVNPSIFLQILWLYFIPLEVNSIHTHTHTPIFQYSFICWWTVKLIPILCYNE